MMAWLAAKAIPWKLVGIALAVLFLLAVAAGGTWYVNNLQIKLVASEKSLAEQVIKTGIALAQVKSVTDQHDNQVLKTELLDENRKVLAEEVSDLRREISLLDLEQDINSDKPDIAADRLNAAHARLNRLLESASRNVRSGAPVESGKAGAPRRD